MTNEINPSATEKPGSPFLVKFFRILLRFLLVLIVGTGLGVLVYYGVPSLYRDFIQPVRLNTQQIADLEDQLALQKEGFREQLDDVQSRLAEAEGRLTVHNEQIAELQAQQASTLENLTAMDEEIQALDQLRDDLADLAQGLADAEAESGRLEESFVARQIPLEAFSRDLETLRAMELITHARLWITQLNFGRAAEDLERAQAALEWVQEQADEVEQEVLQNALERLGRAMTDLEKRPTIASDDLESIWELLNTLLTPPASDLEPDLEAES